MQQKSGWINSKPKKKSQAEKRSEQRMKNSYFTQQYDAYGENFSNFKNPQDIRRESFKIFRALADAAIDLEKHTKCFQDPEFVNTLRDVAYEKMVTHYSTQLGLERIINERVWNNQFVEDFMYQNYTAHQRSAEAYTLLYQAFSNIQITGNYIGVLTTLMPLLNKYKFAL